MTTNQSTRTPNPKPAGHQTAPNPANAMSANAMSANAMPAGHPDSERAGQQRKLTTAQQHQRTAGPAIHTQEELLPTGGNDWLSLAAAAHTILIDGHSGAGKTTFARQLGRVLHRQVIHLDDFYPGWDGLAAGSAIVARDVLHSTAPGFHRWDWHNNVPAEWVPLAPDEARIIEGSGAITEATVAGAHARGGAVLSIRIDAPADMRKVRALTRDADYAPHWTRWAAQEDIHFTTAFPGADLSWEDGTVPVLVLSALLIADADGNILHVRKHNTHSFIMPGGKREAGETPAETVCREIDEELGFTIDSENLTHLGTFEAIAANESNTFVTCDVFAADYRLAQHPTPRAEIAEVAAFSIEDTSEVIAPLSRQVFETLRASGWTPPTRILSPLKNSPEKQD